jgi:MFS-type transporter involved in bile tolerance (Atg22 family)
MSKRQFLMLIGVWVAIFLFLGFPLVWHKIIGVISGLAIIAIAYSFGPVAQKSAMPESVSEAPVENTGENNQPNQ